MQFLWNPSVILFTFPPILFTMFICFLDLSCLIWTLLLHSGSGVESFPCRFVLSLITWAAQAMLHVGCNYLTGCSNKDSNPLWVSKIYLLSLMHSIDNQMCEICLGKQKLCCAWCLATYLYPPAMRTYIRMARQVDWAIHSQNTSNIHFCRLGVGGPTFLFGRG